MRPRPAPLLQEDFHSFQPTQGLELLGPSRFSSQGLELHAKTRWPTSKASTGRRFDFHYLPSHHSADPVPSARLISADAARRHRFHFLSFSLLIYEYLLVHACGIVFDLTHPFTHLFTNALAVSNAAASKHVFSTLPDAGENAIESTQLHSLLSCKIRARTA